jgi:hypothetical protein
MATKTEIEDGVLDFRRFGYLTYAGCARRAELQVLKSQAGWYIGTVNDEGLPCARESQEYWPTQELALQALQNDNWKQKSWP